MSDNTETNEIDTSSEAEVFGSAAPKSRKRRKFNPSASLADTTAALAAPDVDREEGLAIEPAKSSEIDVDALTRALAGSEDALSPFAGMTPPEETPVAEQAPKAKSAAPAPKASAMDDLVVGVSYSDQHNDEPDPDEGFVSSATQSDQSKDDAFGASLLAALGTDIAATVSETEAAPSEFAMPSADASLSDLAPEVAWDSLLSTLEPVAEPETLAPVVAAADDNTLEERVRRAVAETEDDQDGPVAPEAMSAEAEVVMLRRHVSQVNERLERMEALLSAGKPRRFNGHVVSARFTNTMKVAAYEAGTLAIKGGYALRRFFQKGSIGLMVGNFTNRVCMPALRVAKALAIGTVLSYAAISAVEDATGKTFSQQTASIGEVLQEQGVDLETASERVNEHFTAIMNSDPVLEINDFVSRITEVVPIEEADHTAALDPETSIRPQARGEVAPFTDEAVEELESYQPGRI